MGYLKTTVFFAVSLFGLAVWGQTPETCECVPTSGQPAADVLGSEDLWGNPTFIGGVTNGGPDSGSVW